MAIRQTGGIDSLVKAVVSYSPGNAGSVAKLQAALKEVPSSFTNVARDLRSLFGGSGSGSVKAARFASQAPAIPSRAEVIASALIGLERHNPNAAAELAASVFGEIAKDVPIKGVYNV